MVFVFRGTSDVDGGAEVNHAAKLEGAAVA